MKYALCSAIALTVLANSAWAEEKRHADAHEHGHGTFQMVIEDDHVLVEMTVPAFDVIGFEHAPSTPAQRATMADAAAAFGRPDSLFSMPEGAACAIGQIEIGFGATGGHRHDHDGHEEHGDDDHGDEKHDDHAHEDEHDHDKHDDHAHEDEHDPDGHKHDGHKDETTHSEVTAFYRLACTDTDALDRIEFGYFAAFPNAEELEVVILSATGQSAGDVNRDETVFEIE